MLNKRRFSYPPMSAARRAQIEGSQRYYRIQARVAYYINQEIFEAQIDEVRSFDCRRFKDGPSTEELDIWVKAYIQHTFIDNPNWTLNVQANLTDERAKVLLLNVQVSVEPELARVLDFSSKKEVRQRVAR